jgi:WD40-like Beta Propeller Repeat
MKNIITTICLCILTTTGVVAQEFANIEYLCCDWGPAMKLPTKECEKPQFSETDEEVYFLKQLGRFTRGPAGNKGQGVNIYLCKMKPDGSAKTEIKELWHDVRYPIDTQAQSCWLDVNEKTKKIALSVTYAGSDLTGLWTISLDGSELKRIITPERTVKGLQAIDSPTWTPDGQRIVFGESWRGTNISQIVKCDPKGGNRSYLTHDAEDYQPRVSPDGQRIAYIHHVRYARRLYLMEVDGSGQHPLPNPNDKRWGTHVGDYPAWSPDGKKIRLISGGVIDVESGHRLVDRSPIVQGQAGTTGWAHWGRLGFIGYCVGGILFTDADLKEAKWIGSSKLLDCSESKDGCKWRNDENTVEYMCIGLCGAPIGHLGANQQSLAVESNGTNRWPACLSSGTHSFCSRHQRQRLRMGLVWRRTVCSIAYPARGPLAIGTLVLWILPPGVCACADSCRQQRIQQSLSSGATELPPYVQLWRPADGEQQSEP